VATYNSKLAVALEAKPNKQDAGKVVVLIRLITVIKEITVGALPDMITFSPDGNFIMTARRRAK
jgi:hypothetical protein